MNTVLAKPGEKIIITDPDLCAYHGQEWMLTEEPPCGRAFGPHDTEVVWVGPESGPNWPDKQVRIFLYPHQYEIVESKSDGN